MPYDSTDYPVVVVSKGCDEDEVTTLLKDARAIIERGWCQGHFAVNEDGLSRSIDSLSAVSFCSVGALCRAANTTSLENKKVAKSMLHLKTVGNIKNSGGGWSLVIYNDASTKEQVLALFDLAIDQRPTTSL